jgi:hypothetical protein
MMKTYPEVLISWIAGTTPPSEHSFSSSASAVKISACLKLSVTFSSSSLYVTTRYSTCTNQHSAMRDGGRTNLVAPEKGIPLLSLRPVPVGKELLYPPFPHLLRILLRPRPIKRRAQCSAIANSSASGPLWRSTRGSREGTHRRPILPSRWTPSRLPRSYSHGTPRGVWRGWLGVQTRESDQVRSTTSKLVF